MDQSSFRNPNVFQESTLEGDNQIVSNKISIISNSSSYTFPRKDNTNNEASMSSDKRYEVYCICLVRIKEINIFVSYFLLLIYYKIIFCYRETEETARETSDGQEYNSLTISETNSPKYGIIFYSLIMTLLILILLPILLWPYLQHDK